MSQIGGSNLLDLQGFYNPIEDELLEPKLTGISYSFTTSGHYEEAYYRAVANRQSTRESPVISAPADLKVIVDSYRSLLSKGYHAMAAWHIYREQQRVLNLDAVRRRRPPAPVGSVQV